MLKMTMKDYKFILNYYNIPIPKNNITIINKAKKVIAGKLCRCINKVAFELRDGSKSVGVCNRSVLNTKGYTKSNLKCKRPRNVTIKKIKK